jgi:serine/threonine-protein kinase
MICPTCQASHPAGTVRCPEDGATLVPDEAFATVDRDLGPGDQVGEYRVEGKLGEGGFGCVYRAVHPVIGKPAAIKVLSRQFSANPQMVSRFIAEANAVNQIRHKNIIDIFAFGQTKDGRQYYVMELLDGMPFDKYLAHRGGSLSLAEAMPILRGIARAMDAAHAKGILHRDLKPENVFLVLDEEGPIPKLLDFGLVKMLSSSGQHKTKTGTPMGTPYYMSPEQCRGKEVDGRTDVYSFGAMVFQVLTGRVPFDGESAMDILFKHMNEDPPSVSALVPTLPAGVDLPLRSMMAKDPTHRPSTIGAALGELGAAGSVPVGPQAVAAFGTTIPAFGGVPGSVPATAPSPGVRVVTGDGAAEHGAQTFLSSEADVVPTRRSHVWAIVAIAALAAAVGAAGLVFVLRKPAAPVDAGPSVGIVQATPAARAAGSATPAKPSATAPAAPTDVEVRIDGAPAGAKVLADGKELGTAPGPFKLKPGVAVKLTVTAKGYKPRDVELTPTENVQVPIALDKAPAAGPAGGPKNNGISPDLEKF